MITNTTAKSTYIVASGVTEYAIGFVYHTNPDGSPQIKVYKNKLSNTPLVYGVDYTISENGLNVVVGNAVKPGDRLDIIRNIPLVQLSDYVIGRIDPEQIEYDFDASVMRDQQIEGDIQFVGEVPLDHEVRIQECEGDIDDLESLVPTQATSENQLADKNFVNSSIATSTATFRGTYSSLAELEEVAADDNDYGFVVSTDTAGNTVYSRYKYNGTAWVFEYNLNNSSFTADQWAAINSNVTPEKVALIEKVNDSTIIITQGGITKGSFTLNQSSGGTIALDAGGASGHEVIAFQAPTAANNYTWYRKYADGWVEQGGITESSAGSTAKNIVFPIEMADTNYTALVTIYGSLPFGDAGNNPGVQNNNTTTGMAIYSGNTGSLFWEVKGMYAQS